MFIDKTRERQKNKHMKLLFIKNLIRLFDILKI